MTDVFEYLDYRDFLRDAFAERKATNASFSYRLLARRIGVDASRIHRVLAKRAHVATDQIGNFASAFALTRRRRQYFEYLVRFAKATNPEDSRVWLEKASGLRGPASRRLKSDEHGVFRDWYLIPLRSLLHTGVFADDWDLLASCLVPAIRPDQARQGVESLERWGLARRNADGFWQAAESHLAADGAIPGGALRAWHHAMLRLAGEALERHPKSARHHATLTVGVDASGAAAIAELLRECRRSIQKIADTTPAPDRVLHLGMHLFPVGRIPRASAAAEDV